MLAVRCGNDGIKLADVGHTSGEGVRVRVTQVGICGSDLAFAANGLGEGLPPEVTLGHEIVGLTPEGTPVAIEPLLPCGKCNPCRLGTYNLCIEDRWLGGSLDGGMTEEIVVPERCLVEIPPSVAPSDACLAEPLAVALHGLRRAGASSGELVAIIGGGTIGLMATAAAVMTGCATTVVARHEHQRELARQLGAEIAEIPVDQDLVVAAAGEAAGVADAVAAVRPHGRVLVLNEPQSPFLPPESVLKEVTAVTSIAYAKHNGSRDIDDAMQLLAENPEIARMITHRFPLEEAEKAFEAAADRTSGAIKVVLEPRLED